MTLFGYGAQAKDTWLFAEGWEPDTYSEGQDGVSCGSDNGGFEARRMRFLDSNGEYSAVSSFDLRSRNTFMRFIFCHPQKSVQYVARLGHPLQNSDAVLFNDFTVQFLLQRSDRKFPIMHAEPVESDYRIAVDSCEVHVCVATYTRSIYDRLTRELKLNRKNK